MYRRLLLTLAAACVVASGCSGSSAAQPTLAPSPTRLSDLSQLPTAQGARVEITRVQGAAPGGRATVAATTTPEALCRLIYQVPSGLLSGDPSLGPRPASSDGTITWTWNIPQDSRTGTGKVTVNCNGAEAKADITIG